jgi:hypothetical protein
MNACGIDQPRVIFLSITGFGKLVFDNMVHILFITIAGVILPLYMLQIGIRFCNPFFVMITTTLVPVFTFIFQLFDPRIKWSNTSLIGINLILFFSLLSVMNHTKREA